MPLPNGTVVWATNDRDAWRELTADGLPVFSGGELERLRIVLSGMDADERERAVGQIIDVKVALGGYITEARA